MTAAKPTKPKPKATTANVKRKAPAKRRLAQGQPIPSAPSVNIVQNPPVNIVHNPLTNLLIGEQNVKSDFSHNQAAPDVTDPDIEIVKNTLRNICLDENS
ncbi:MAG: hypothetical protein U5N55_02215 [Cypionkella sp.]|nr:hypothetical protein [Cypionkella sp.]